MISARRVWKNRLTKAKHCSAIELWDLQNSQRDVLKDEYTEWRGHILNISTTGRGKQKYVYIYGSKQVLRILQQCLIFTISIALSQTFHSTIQDLCAPAYASCPINISLSGFISLWLAPTIFITFFRFPMITTLQWRALLRRRFQIYYVRIPGAPHHSTCLHPTNLPISVSMVICCIGSKLHRSRLGYTMILYCLISLNICMGVLFDIQGLTSGRTCNHPSWKMTNIKIRLDHGDPWESKRVSVSQQPGEELLVFYTGLEIN